MAWTSAVTRATGYGVTAAVWNSEHVDNMNFLKRVGITAVSSPVNLNTTTVGTAVQIASLGAITYENVPHKIAFWAPRIGSAAVICNIIIRDGTTVLATVQRFGTGE